MADNLYGILPQPKLLLIVTCFRRIIYSSILTITGAKSKKLTLSWVRRLKIAVDAGKGTCFLIEK